MDISEFDGIRFEAAMDMFSEGGAISFAGVSFRLAAPDVLECQVRPSWPADSITEARAREDIASVHRTIEHLRRSAPRFGRLIDGRRPTVELFVGPGMGAVGEICTESAGEIVWKPGFPIGSAP